MKAMGIQQLAMYRLKGMVPNVQLSQKFVPNIKFEAKITMSQYKLMNKLKKF